MRNGGSAVVTVASGWSAKKQTKSISCWYSTKPSRRASGSTGLSNDSRRKTFSTPERAASFIDWSSKLQADGVVVFRGVYHAVQLPRAVRAAPSRRHQARADVAPLMLDPRVAARREGEPLLQRALQRMRRRIRPADALRASSPRSGRPARRRRRGPRGRLGVLLSDAS